MTEHCKKEENNFSRHPQIDRLSIELFHTKQLYICSLIQWTTSLRGRGTEPGTTEEATVSWSGKARPQPDICSLRTSLTPGD